MDALNEVNIDKIMHTAQIKLRFIHIVVRNLAFYISKLSQNLVIDSLSNGRVIAVVLLFHRFQ